MFKLLYIEFCVWFVVKGSIVSWMCEDNCEYHGVREWCGWLSFQSGLCMLNSAFFQNSCRDGGPTSSWLMRSA